MGELLDSVKPLKDLRRGDVIEGTVMQVDAEGIHVNIGHKAEGVVPPREMRSIGPDGPSQVEVGSELVTLVVRSETGDSPAILSIDRALGEMGWRTLSKVMDSGESIEGTVVGFNRGGAIVEAEGVHGFVPMSQLVTVSRDHFRELRERAEQPSAPTAEQGSPQEPDTPTEAAEPAEPAKSEQAAEPERPSDIGKVLKVKVLEVNRGRNRAIFSERQVIEQQRDELKAKLIEELSVGEVRRGRVTGISSFGAFVDLGGADGLVHISELSWKPINTPDEIVSVGQEVDVYVLKVDAENRKIALSLRRLQPEPWETINERHNTGDIVNATVTKLTNFGAFARVEDSIEGLIHISELSARMINHPREVVREGDQVQVKILRIEPERRRLGLSLKQASEERYF
jgi:small subunit ribosomal protein S1